MATEEMYEGWTNRETWAIQLHLSNNEGDYHAMREHAEAIVRDELDSTDGAWADYEHRSCAGLMADYIKAWTEEVFESVTHPDSGTLNSYETYTETPTEAARMFVSDVGSYWRADFYQIASHWIDDAREALADA